MGRLTNIKPRLGTLAPRIGYQQGDEQARSRHRDISFAYRAWYKTARWQKLRWSILVRDNFTCRMCGHMNLDKHGLHCDHVEPHHGNEQAFWAGPFMTLCANCHNSEKQKREKRGWA